MLYFLAIFLLLIAIAYGLSYNARHEEQEKPELDLVGKKPQTGHILAAKERKASSKKKRNPDIEVKLRYFDKAKQEMVEVLHKIPETTEDLHPHVAHIVGLSTQGLVITGLQEAKEHADKLRAQGYSPEQIQKINMERALELATQVTESSKDSDGYTVFKKPIEVKVFIIESSENPKLSRPYVVFNKYVPEQLLP